MTRGFLSILLITALALPMAANAQGRSSRGGQGASQQNRVHSPGTGQMGGDQIRQQDRLRDGTGANCQGCPSSATTTQRSTRTPNQTQSNAQTQNQAQTRNQSQTQNQVQTGNQIQNQTQNKVQNQTQTQGGTQNQVRTGQQQQTQNNLLR
jgi:hypothetical protein